MKLKFVILLILLGFTDIINSQSFKSFRKIEIKDTLTTYDKATKATWFKQDLKDTIICYRMITIDSIICNQSRCDTIFRIQNYDKGYRYFGDKFFVKDSVDQEYGSIFKGLKTGLWDFTGSPSCFSEGTLYISRYYYFQGHRLGAELDFDSIYYDYGNDGFQAWIKYHIDESKDAINIEISCNKNDSSQCNCTLRAIDGLFIRKVPINSIGDEINGLMIGVYDRELLKKYNR